MKFGLIEFTQDGFTICNSEWISGKLQYWDRSYRTSPFLCFGYKMTQKKFLVYEKLFYLHSRIQASDCVSLWLCLVHFFVRINLDSIVLANASKFYRHEKVKLSIKYPYFFIFKKHVMLSAKTDVFSLNVLSKSIPRAVQRTLIAPRNSACQSELFLFFVLDIFVEDLFCLCGRFRFQWINPIIPRQIFNYDIQIL